MEKVINLVINQIEILRQRLGKLEYITETYHEYKKEKEDFIKYLDKKLERENKDRDGDSTRDNGQQAISKSRGSDGTSKGISGRGGEKGSNNKKKKEKDNESVWNIVKDTI